MAREVINTGDLPSANNGDPLRTAFDKVNNNFDSIFADPLHANIQLIDPSQFGTDSNTGNNSTVYTSSTTTNNISNSINIHATNIYVNQMPQGSAPPSPLRTGTPEIVNLGTVPNDGHGDPLRVAFNKINNNFANLANLFLAAYPPPAPPPPPEPPAPKVLNFTTPYGPFGAQEYINVGAQANDGTGDPLRIAFEKINNNFSNLFYTTTNTEIAYSVGLTPDQVIFEFPVSLFTQGNFQIKSMNPDNMDSQDITLTAQITNNNLDVKWTGYGTTFSGTSYVTRYDMDVLDDNVRVKVNPLVNEVLLHFIAYQTTFIGSTPPGIPIGVNGPTPDTSLCTEDGLIITTEGV